MGNIRRAAPKTYGAVGPPSGAGHRLAGEEVYYEDDEADKGLTQDPWRMPTMSLTSPEWACMLNYNARTGSG